MGTWQRAFLFYGWYVYHSQSWVVCDIVFTHIRPHKLLPWLFCLASARCCQVWQNALTSSNLTAFRGQVTHHSCDKNSVSHVSKSFADLEDICYQWCCRPYWFPIWNGKSYDTPFHFQEFYLYLSLSSKYRNKVSLIHLDPLRHPFRHPLRHPFACL